MPSPLRASALPASWATAALLVGVVWAAGGAEPVRADPLQKASGHALADTVPAPRPEVARRPPSDTYESPALRRLLSRARGARNEGVRDLESWEGRMWERQYVGLHARGFRRQRSLWVQERQAYVRWARSGPRLVRWEGARRSVPLAGMSSVDDAERARELAADLAEGRLPPLLSVDPGSDRIVFGGTWALNPLADTAHHHYRFRHGDTLRVRMAAAGPGSPDELELVEVLVEPRRADPRLLAGSLWLERETGRLARSAFRPARPFDLELDAPEDGAEMPGFLLPIQAEIHHITVDHALFDFRWWIPRRFAFQGEARIGGMGRLPVEVEWLLEDIRVNSPATDPLERVPEGWSRTEREVEVGGDTVPAVVVVAPPDSLAARLSPRGPMRDEALARLSARERSELEEGLRRLLPRDAGAHLQLHWGLREGLTRYNRVEGLSSGVALEVPLSPELRGRLAARLGVADLEPGVEVALLRRPGRGQDRLAAYRRLEPSADWENPFSLGASAGTLLFGNEFFPFHRTAGVEAVRIREGHRLRTRLRLFSEVHRSARRGTHMHLARLFSGDPLPPNPPAQRGWFTGLQAGLQWQSARIRDRGLFLLEGRAEGATGQGSYVRGWGSGALQISLADRWTAALEAGGGWSEGDLPAQRRFFPGGRRVYRAARVGERAADTFWFGRVELGRGMPGARLTTFLDLVAAGPREQLFGIRPDAAVGLGVSLLEGLVRLDLTRELDGRGRTRLVAYLDGLL